MPHHSHATRILRSMGVKCKTEGVSGNSFALCRRSAPNWYWWGESGLRECVLIM
ncbi:hypothetical protein ACLOJK_009510 [Asimina triloba]